MASNIASHRNDIQQIAICIRSFRGGPLFSSASTPARSIAGRIKAIEEAGSAGIGARDARRIFPTSIGVVGVLRRREHGCAPRDSGPGAEPDAVSGYGVVAEPEVRTAGSVLQAL